MSAPDPPQVDTRRLSRLPLYERWLRSWEAALAALTNASRTGALSTDEAARHRTVIATERDLVVEQLTLLAGQAGAEVAIAYSGALKRARV